MAFAKDPYTDIKPWQQYNVRNDNIYEGITVLRGLVDMDSPPAERFYSSAIEHEIEMWKSTEKGQWCMDKAFDWKMMKEPDHSAFGYRYAVRCLFTPKDATFYRMKWGGNQ